LNFTPTGGSTDNTTYTWLTGDGNSMNSTADGAEYAYQAAGKYCVTKIARNDAGCECSSTKCVTINTNLNDAESMTNAVSIYPNPDRGIFTAALALANYEQMTINVHNTIGELVKTIVLDSNNTTVDLSDHASGVYTAQLSA